MIFANNKTKQIFWSVFGIVACFITGVEFFRLLDGIFISFRLDIKFFFLCNISKAFVITKCVREVSASRRTMSYISAYVYTISEKGIHGDFGPKNLLLRNGKEGVISDFGSYRPYDEARRGLTTLTVRSPEYYTKEALTSKFDVWGMGIALHLIFSTQKLPCWDYSEEMEDEFQLWVFGLTPDWMLKYPTCSDTPPFLAKLINEMLDPRVEKRPTPKEVLGRFTEARQ